MRQHCVVFRPGLLNLGEIIVLRRLAFFELGQPDISGRLFQTRNVVGLVQTDRIHRGNQIVAFRPGGKSSNTDTGNFETA